MMDFWIFCVILFTSVARHAGACDLTADETRCAYIVTCDAYMDSYLYWSEFETHPRYAVDMEYPSDDEICPKPVLYRGHHLYPVYLIFRENIHKYQNIDAQIPPAEDWEQEKVLDIVYGLDLSHVGYSQSPIINKRGNLVKLNLSYNYLSTAVLSNVNELKMLTEIDLSNNIISDIEINYDQYTYTHLININLSHNRLVKLPDGIFSKFDNLQELNVSYNYIDMLTGKTFENIKNMEILDLSNNELASLYSAFFRFKELKVLNLSHNKLNDLNLTDFEPLLKLKILDLSSNYIGIIYDNTLKSMYSFQSLTNIDLSKNKLRSLPHGLFENSTILNFSIIGNRLEGVLDKSTLQGINVTKLDFSGQNLTEIKDYAFSDNIRLITLLLQSNNIKLLSKMCFINLVNLRELDLSNNQINKIDFDKKDLTNLKSLLLKNNQLTEIEYAQLLDLVSLEYLDLSENYISRLDSGSFKSLRNLINLDITHNPLSSTLETGTFDGLESLSTLDLSRRILSKIENATFNNMIQLKYLNMSYCKINELHYNTFIHTGNIESLDLSYNKLAEFSVNITELVQISTLLLNNNLIKTISLSTFNKIVSSYNGVENAYNEIYHSLTSLTYLDLSFNENLNFTAPICKDRNVNTLNLVGVKTRTNFAFIMTGCSIANLYMSNGTVENINDLHLSKLTNINSLDISYNNVSMLQVGAFKNLITLKILDLSFNKITFIQPGVFKENSNLQLLNISHNLLSSVKYGIFRGLIRLSTLDISYNHIKDLQTERFYETETLSELIVDHNKIDTFNALEFAGTRLRKLSIGDNPLPCEILANLQQRRDISLEITAVKRDEHSNENINGVTCNKHHEPVHALPDKASVNDDVLDRALKILTNNTYNNIIPDNSIVQYLKNISGILDKLSVIIDINNKTNSMVNHTNVMLNESNIMLNKIMKKKLQSTAATVAGSLEQETRITFLSTHKSSISEPIMENTTTTDKSKTELGNLVLNNAGKQTIFIETCVGMILVILIGLVLYKIYRSREFIRDRLTVSTRNLPGSIENSSL